MRSTLVVFVLALLAGPAAAAVKPAYSKLYDACMAKAVSTLDMDDCNKGELSRRTPLLNKAFQDSLGRLEDNMRPKLRAAERAWIASRDADCGLYEDRESFGSFGVIEAGQCMIDRTLSRTKDLEAMFPSMADPGQ